MLSSRFTKYSFRLVRQYHRQKHFLGSSRFLINAMELNYFLIYGTFSGFRQLNLSYSSWNVGTPDSKVHGANTGPIWGRQVGPMLAPWTLLSGTFYISKVSLTGRYHKLQIKNPTQTPPINKQVWLPNHLIYQLYWPLHAATHRTCDNWYMCLGTLTNLDWLDQHRD